METEQRRIAAKNRGRAIALFIQVSIDFPANAALQAQALSQKSDEELQHLADLMTDEKALATIADAAIAMHERHNKLKGLGMPLQAVKMVLEVDLKHARELKERRISGNMDKSIPLSSVS